MAGGDGEGRSIVAAFVRSGVRRCTPRRRPLNPIGPFAGRTSNAESVPSTLPSVVAGEGPEGDMDEIVTYHEGDEVDEYEPGVPLGEVARGFLTRFLPASVASLFGVVAVASSGQLGPLVGLLETWTGLVALGFGLGILGLHRWLYPDAKVAGLRSVLAGLLAPLLPLAFFCLAALLDLGLQLTPWQAGAIFVLGGMLAATAMFFPWLVATPPEMRGEAGPILDDRDNKSLGHGAS